MQIPVEVTFHGMDKSAAVEASITRWMERLAHFHDRIQHAHVWIAMPHRHHRHGAAFQVRVVLGIPGDEVGTTGEHAEVYGALADAFLAARRQLQDAAQIRRGEVKRHRHAEVA